MVIRSIEVVSAGKVLGCLYFLLGLLMGLPFSLLSLAGIAAVARRGAGGGGVGVILFGVGAVIILPLLCGAFGFIAGVITAQLYNLVVAVVGGIEFSVDHR